jgi:hypothetical protein
MLTLFWVLAGVISVFAVYTLLAPTAFYLPRLVGTRKVHCPARNIDAEVRVNVPQAALAMAYGGKSVDVYYCSQLRTGDRCDAGCLRH